MNNACIFCKRAVSEHTKDEALSCALKICEQGLMVKNGH